MAATSTVDPEGRVTLPAELLREIGGQLGDTVTLRAIRTGTVKLKVSSGAARGRVSVPAPIDHGAISRPSRAEGPPGPADQDLQQEFIPLTLAEMLERSKIEGPIDEEDLREGWHDDAARDAIKSTIGD